MCVAGSGVVQNQEMYFEGGHEDEDRDNNETGNTGSPMLDLITLSGYKRKFRLRCGHLALTTGIFKSPNFSHRSSIVYRPTKAVTKRPISLTLRKVSRDLWTTYALRNHLVTQPIENPVRVSQVHHSKEKDLKSGNEGLEQNYPSADLLILMIVKFG